LYFINLAFRLFETSCLFNLVQSGQLVNIEGYVFQEITPGNKARSMNDDYALCAVVCQPQ
jgi:hypothetical protein